VRLIALFLLLPVCSWGFVAADPSLASEPGGASHHVAVDESEVEEVPEHPGEDRPGREGSRIAVGKTRSGRYLRVIYVPDPEPGSVFVVTAYELSGRPLAAYRRRMRRKGRR